MTWLLWLILALGAFGILETKALYDRIPGTTLSAWWWGLRRSVFIRILVGGALGWVGWHLLSPFDDETGGWDDALAIVLGAGILAAIPYKTRTGQ